jgi:hypothetical protein
MAQFLLVAVTGWLAVLATGIEAALPFIFRGLARQTPGPPMRSPASFPTLLTRMWPHYWLGYALLALVLVHTSFVMGSGMGRTDATGIWAATLALCLLFLQVAVGLMLKARTGDGRPLRRIHFWSMLGLIALILTHLWRNA